MPKYLGWCPGVESAMKFTAPMRLRMNMSGFRAYHVCLSIVLIILVFDIVAIAQIQGFQDRAMETQARVWSFRHGQTIQYVDPRTGNVYAKPLWGSSKVMVNGRSLRVNEVVDILFDPRNPNSFYMKSVDLWQVPKVSVILIGFFLVLAAFLWRYSRPQISHQAHLEKIMNGRV